MNFSFCSFVLSVMKISKIFAGINQLVGLFPSLYQYRFSKRCISVSVLVVTATFGLIDLFEKP